jgi:hypothetical protein
MNVVVGDVVMVKLDSIKPNTWNPNRMTQFQKDALEHGLKSDGWLKSQSLLVWGTDDKGKLHNVIIDGEHRWVAARNMGFVDGPAVVLNGLPRAKAKALTIKMNSKRGAFEGEQLGALLKELEHELVMTDMPLEFGIESEDLFKFLAMEPEHVQDDEFVKSAKAIDAGLLVSASPKGRGHISMLQLFYTKEEVARVHAWVKQLKDKYKTDNTSSTIFEVLRDAAKNTA